MRRAAPGDWFPRCGPTRRRCTRGPPACQVARDRPWSRRVPPHQVRHPGEQAWPRDNSDPIGKRRSRNPRSRRSRRRPSRLSRLRRRKAPRASNRRPPHLAGPSHRADRSRHRPKADVPSSAAALGQEGGERAFAAGRPRLERATGSLNASSGGDDPHRDKRDRAARAWPAAPVASDASRHRALSAAVPAPNARQRTWKR
jgi:hypothetical protein